MEQRSQVRQYGLCGPLIRSQVAIRTNYDCRRVLRPHKVPVIECDDIADLGSVLWRHGFRIRRCKLYDYLGFWRNFYLLLKVIQRGILHAHTVQGTCLEDLPFLETDTLVWRARNPVPVVIRVPSVHIQEYGPYFTDRRANRFSNTEIFRKFVRNSHSGCSWRLRESADIDVSVSASPMASFSR